MERAEGNGHEPRHRHLRGRDLKAATGFEIETNRALARATPAPG